MHGDENSFSVALDFFQLIREQKMERVAGDFRMLGRRVIKCALRRVGGGGVVSFQFQIARRRAGDFDIRIAGDLRGAGGVDGNSGAQTNFPQRRADERFDVIAGLVGAGGFDAFLRGAFAGERGGGENFLLQFDVCRIVRVEVEDVKTGCGLDDIFEGNLFFRSGEFTQCGDQVGIGLRGGKGGGETENQSGGEKGAAICFHGLRMRTTCVFRREKSEQKPTFFWKVPVKNQFESALPPAFLWIGFIAIDSF